MDHTEQLLHNLARDGYDAYGEDAGWRNYAGLPMPAWNELTDAVRSHWVAAVCGVLDSAETLGARDFMAVVDVAVERLTRDGDVE